MIGRLTNMLPTIELGRLRIVTLIIASIGFSTCAESRFDKGLSAANKFDKSVYHSFAAVNFHTLMGLIVNYESFKQDLYNHGFGKSEGGSIFDDNCIVDEYGAIRDDGLHGPYIKYCDCCHDAIEVKFMCNSWDEKQLFNIIQQAIDFGFVEDDHLDKDGGGFSKYYEYDWFIMTVSSNLMENGDYANQVTITYIPDDR